MSRVALLHGDRHKVVVRCFSIAHPGADAPRRSTLCTSSHRAQHRMSHQQQQPSARSHSGGAIAARSRNQAQQNYKGGAGKCSPEPESAQGPLHPLGCPRQQPCRALAGEVSEAVCVHPHRLTKVTRYSRRRHCLLLLTQMSHCLLDELPALHSCSSLIKLIGLDLTAASSRLYLKTDEHVLLVPGPRAAEKFCLCRPNTAHVRNNDRWRANFRPSAT